MDIPWLLGGSCALLIGLLLIGSGMTGKVVSMSCCFGEGCAHLCDAAERTLPPMSTDAQMRILAGSALLLCGTLGVARGAATGKRNNPS